MVVLVLLGLAPAPVLLFAAVDAAAAAWTAWSLRGPLVRDLPHAA
jgi:hypothetical protein